jgi:hypothetical protein
MVFIPKITICVYLEGLRIKNVGIFNDHLEYLSIFGIFCGYLIYFVVIWYILWLFGIFSPFWYDVPRKIWQPCPGPQLTIGFRADMCD